VRGVSDYADTSKASTESSSRGQYREVAMRSATLYMLTLLRELLSPGTRSDGNWAVRKGSEESGFIGRAQELRKLERLLKTTNSARLITVTGEGGIGKTRLASEFVRRMGSSSSFDHVVWVDLGSTFTVEDVIGEIGRGAGVEVAAVGDADGLVEVLRSRRDILVLDNFESVASRAPLISLLLDGCPRLRILVTSRERLHLTGEHCLQLPPLSHDVQDLSSEAVQLFLATATGRSADTTWRGTELESISQICSLVDGIPLAIEILASHTNHFAVTDILNRLRDPGVGAHFLGRLPGAESGSRRRTLDETFESSCQLLEEPYLHLLEELSYFSGGATLDALTQVSTAEDPTIVTHGIQRLMDRSLVRADTSGMTTRYYLLAPLRQFASRRLNASPRFEAIQNHHADYFCELARVAGKDLFGPQQHVRLDEVEADVWNFATAHSWALRNDRIQDAMSLVSGLARLWFVRNQVRTGQSLAERIEGAPFDRSDCWADWTITRALLAWMRGRSSQADALLITASEYGDDFDKPYYLSNALSNRGLVALFEGRVEQARSYYAEGARVAETSGDTWNLAICRAGLGSVNQSVGEVRAALDLYLDGLQLFRDTGDTWSLARVLRRLADVGVSLDDQELVSSASQEAASLAELLKDAHAPAELDRILGRNAAKRGMANEAVIRYIKSAQSYVGLGRHQSAITSLHETTSLLIATGRIQEAGRTRGVIRQLLEKTDGISVSPSDMAEPTRVTERVSFAVGFDAGFRGSPHAELEYLLRVAVEGRLTVE